MSEMLCESIVLQPRLIQLVSFTLVAEVVWDQVETLRLRRPVPGEIDDYGIFWFRALESSLRPGF